MSQHRLTIESQYCKNWKVTDAIRELIQNALDTKTEVTIDRYDSTRFTIADQGRGIDLSDFLVGRSSKSDDPNVIGQFGEGLSVGTLVLARNGRKITIRSKDKIYEITFSFDQEWNTQLLTIDMEQTDLIKGTLVTIEASISEIEAAKSLFLKYDHHELICRNTNYEILRNSDSTIEDGCGKVYVNGLCVTSLRSLFSYNILGASGKKLVNRDRNAINYICVKEAIAEVLSKTEHPFVINTLLATGSTYRKNTKQLIEHEVTIYATDCDPWMEAVKELFGEKVCKSYDSRSDQNAKDLGYTVLDLPYGISRLLDIENSMDVACVDRELIDMDDLEPDQIVRVKKAWRMADKVIKIANLDPIEDIKFYDDDDGTQGIVHDGIIALNQRHLYDALHILAGTIIHEVVHLTSGNSDNTRAFENDLTNVISEFVHHTNKKICDSD